MVPASLVPVSSLNRSQRESDHASSPRENLAFRFLRPIPGDNPQNYLQQLLNARLGVRPGSCQASWTREFVLSFLHEKLDTLYGKHTRNSGER
jgi:hypothetical protein